VLRTRVVTAVVLIAAFLSALFRLPPIPWAVATLAVLALAAWEWARLSRFDGAGGWAFVALVPTVAVAWTRIAPGLPAPWYLAPYVVATAFWLFVVPAWMGRLSRVDAPFALAAAGIVAIVPTWLALLDLRAVSPWLLLVSMAVVWISDSAAYFTGRAVGRRKLAPAISPGKTWEGVAGAVFAVAAFAAALAPALALSTDAGLAWVGSAGAWLVLAALALCALGIEGDLYESWLKRCAGLKDSSGLLPGHGGILDRIDALTSTLPVAALVVGLARRTA
jgi:phosphatidate cytidylyltransferase